METVKMENRAWKGIRLVSDSITQQSKEYIYSIDWHVPIGKFYLEEQVTHLDRFEGKTTIHPTFAKHIGYADRIQPLIKWIENNRNVKVKIDNPEALKANEQYAIDDGERLLKKYPKWKTKISPQKIIA